MLAFVTVGNSERLERRVFDSHLIRSWRRNRAWGSSPENRRPRPRLFNDRGWRRETSRRPSFRDNRRGVLTEADKAESASDVVLLQAGYFQRSWKSAGSGCSINLYVRDRGVRANEFFSFQLGPEFRRDSFSQDIEVLVDSLRDTRSRDNRGNYRMGQSKLRSSSL